MFLVSHPSIYAADFLLASLPWWFAFLTIPSAFLLLLCPPTPMIQIRGGKQSHRTVTRVRSVSSPPLILMFLAISMVIAAAAIPFWELILVLGTGFWLTSTNEVRKDEDYRYFLFLPLLFLLSSAPLYPPLRLARRPNRGRGLDPLRRYCLALYRVV